MIYRVAIVWALLVGSAGAAIPFGISSGPGNGRVTNLEWVLCGVHLVVAVVLAVTLFGRRGYNWQDEAFAIAAGAWSATSILEGWLCPGASVRARFALGLMFGAAAALAFCAYVASRTPPPELGDPPGAP